LLQAYVIYPVDFLAVLRPATQDAGGRPVDITASDPIIRSRLGSKVQARPLAALSHR
jgi:hypothetical protein